MIKHNAVRKSKNNKDASGRTVLLHKNKKREILLVPFILLAVTAIILLFSPIFNIKKIEVKGIHKISENTVINESKITYGSNILKMNKVKIKNNLTGNSYIEKANIRRKWPDTVLIEITEREAVARVAFLGSEILIDENANILEIVTQGSNGNDLPELENIDVVSYETGSILETNNEENLKTFIDILKKLKNNDMLKKVEKISINDGLNLYLIDGHVAKLGEKINLDYKIMYLKEIISREKNKALIDLTNPEQPILKPVWGTLN